MEIVQIECRCKDCIHYEFHPIYRIKNEKYCTYWDWEKPNCVNEDDFCNHGVKRINDYER